MKITRILAILLIGILLIITACSSTESPPKTAPDPKQTPATIPKLEYQDDSFTIRLTGSRTVFDQRELDRRWGEAEKLADRLRDESYANENAEFKELLRLNLDGEISQEEYERRRAEMTTRYGTERNEIREEYFAVLHAPNDDLYSDSPNVKYSGSYMVVTSSGGTTSRSMDGTTPAGGLDRHAFGHGMAHLESGGT